MGPFSIDPTEVTVAEFAAYAARRDVMTAAETEGGGFEWGAGWERRSGWTFRTPYGADASAQEPAVHVSWAEARDYCSDRNGRLPTLAEWKAAAYTERRPAPPDGFTTGTTYEYPVGNKAAGMNNNRKRHMPVGSTRQGVNGLYDMGGNVWEWLSDRRGEDALTAGGSPGGTDRQRHAQTGCSGSRPPFMPFISAFAASMTATDRQNQRIAGV